MFVDFVEVCGECVKAGGDGMKLFGTYVEVCGECVDMCGNFLEVCEIV